MVARSLLYCAMLLGVVAATFAGSTAPAQTPDAQCRFFKVQSSTLNIAKEPRADSGFIDALDKDDILCVTRDQQVGDRIWGFVAYKLANRQQRPVQGWAIMRSLQPASPTEVAAAGGPPVPAASASAAATAAAPAAPAPADEIVRFSQAITFGPYPVNGQSLEQLITGVPLFPPIEGLPEKVWQKSCNNCHKWNQQTLCEQATLYVKNPAAALRIVHPYGGPEKIAMSNWARNGCQ